MDPAGNTDGAPDDATRRDDLRRAAADAADATWGHVHGRHRSLVYRAIGLFSGDVGPKADVAGGMRSHSVRQRARRGEVPYGTTTPGSGRYILAALALLVGGAVALLALLAWLVG